MENLVNTKLWQPSFKLKRNYMYCEPKQYGLQISILTFSFLLQYREQASKVGPRVALGSPPLH